jgi:Pvc16 N-terminal domain
MFLLHETPILSRAQLRTVLGAPSPVDGAILPSQFGTLSALDLADQIELIKISPIYMSTEELSKMWTAMQARYRPTMAYLVTTVLIQATDSTKAAPPVLSQGKQDTGPVATAAPLPVISIVRPAASALLPAIRLGDDVLLGGTNFGTSGAASVQFQNARAELTQVVAPKSVTGTQIKAHIPNFAEDNDALHSWAVGMYSVSLLVSRPNLPDYVSNAVPVALSPIITVSPQNTAAGNIDLTVTCNPRLLKSQESRTQLVFRDQTFTPTVIDTPVDVKQPTTLKFKVPGVAAGQYLVRLRVDGVDSIPAVFQGTPPKLSFDPQQKVTVT